MKHPFYYGLFVHCVVLYGGIDLNFKSPLQEDLPQFQATDNPPADRLVLIVADGLRDERLIALGLNVTPHLMNIMFDRGAAGIAIASVPTESRPGHISLLAGIYEDPSAIFKGWQDNPVKFDSIINQSSHAFAWGSTDILDLFNKEYHPHIHFYTYTREMQNFKNPSIELDRWVLQRVEKMFEEMVERDCKEFCAKKTVFFLHLLGMDNAGHAYKPNSKKYEENLKFVDQLVKRVEELFTDFFVDNRTTFIFTADHGMTNWGSHGSGSEHETHVPVLAWGAGISKGQKRTIKQLDMTPLMAALIGINIPTNSLGLMPAEYLNVDQKTISDIMFANTKQYAALYSKVEESKRSTLGFKPFPPLAKHGFLHEKVDIIKQLIDVKDYETAINKTKVLLIMLEHGRKYYLDYYKGFMVGCLAFAVHMWFMYLVIISTDNYGDDVMREITRIPICDFIVFVSAVFLLPLAITCIFVSELPIPTYFYIFLPFACTIMFLRNYKRFIHAAHTMWSIGFFNWVKQVILYACGVLSLICSFSDRGYFVPILIGMGVWGWSNKRNLTVADRAMWCIMCGISCIFAILPSITISELMTHCVGVAAWICVTGMVIKLVYSTPAFYALIDSNHSMLPPFIGIIIVFITCLLLGLKISFSDTVPDYINLVCWYLLGFIASLPLMVPKSVLCRLLVWLFAFMSYYALVSAKYELVFMLAYTTLLIQWLILEAKLAPFGISSFIATTKGEQLAKQLRPHDPGQQLVRRAFFYLTFALLGVFGTGNFAQLSSFDPMWVKPFLTSFNPFIITGLIVLKISVPIMMCTIVLYTINIVTPERVKTLFTVIMAICELMLINFLINIKNEGSWLDIGTSISKFIVCGVLTLVVMLYYQLSHTLMTHSML